MWCIIFQPQTISSQPLISHKSDYWCPAVWIWILVTNWDTCPPAVLFVLVAFMTVTHSCVATVLYGRFMTVIAFMIGGESLLFPTFGWFVVSSLLSGFIVGADVILSLCCLSIGVLMCIEALFVICSVTLPSRCLILIVGLILCTRSIGLLWTSLSSLSTCQSTACRSGRYF